MLHVKEFLMSYISLLVALCIYEELGLVVHSSFTVLKTINRSQNTMSFCDHCSVSSNSLLK